MSTQHEYEEVAVKLKTPNKYHVIFLNDNFTPMEYVVQVLKSLYNKTTAESKVITHEVHEKGRSVAGAYSYEVAEQKCVETITDARKHGFPLDVIMEEST